MLRIIRNGFLRGTVAAVLVFAIVLCSGCVSVVLAEKPTEEATVLQNIPTQPPVMADADLTFPDEIQGSYVPGSNIEPVTDANGEVVEPEKDLEIDWNTRVVTEKDPNELLLIEAWESKDHQQVHIAQPHMAQLRTFNSDYIQSAKLGEFELK